MLLYSVNGILFLRKDREVYKNVCGMAIEILLILNLL